MRGKEEKGPSVCRWWKAEALLAPWISLLGDTLSDQGCSREGLLCGIVSNGEEWYKKIISPPALITRALQKCLAPFRSFFKGKFQRKQMKSSSASANWDGREQGSHRLKRSIFWGLPYYLTWFFPFSLLFAFVHWNITRNLCISHASFIQKISRRFADINW